MNSRGDIPITIFIIGVFVLCGIVLFSFSISNLSKSTVTSKNLEMINYLNSASEKYSFYKEMGFDSDTAFDYVNQSTLRIADFGINFNYTTRNVCYNTLEVEICYEFNP